ncbi:MAG TPA: HD domain-containing phosphohydrolase [Coriobacteriia bacterium]|nr:HD domain-containing phosphohydrolase [Coriobacteriia bacterium]
MSDRDIAARAFSTSEWRAAADALFQATGISVNVMDFASGEALCAANPCGYCHLATDVQTPGPGTCFDGLAEPGAGVGRAVCRAGLASLLAAVERDGRSLGHVVVSGFVTSTRERRGLYERLLVRGVSEDTARRSIKALPVVSRRQAEAYLQIAVSSARTVADATGERLAAAERVEELRLFVSAGHQVVSTEHLDESSLSAIAEEAVSIISAPAGAVLRPRGASLEVVARTGDWRGPVGALVPRASTVSGRAFDTRKTVVSPAGAGGAATLAMPLMIGRRAVGVLEARVDPAALPLPQERLSRLNRFGQFVAIALEREDERQRVQRAMNGYGQLNELASSLGGQTDTDGVATFVIDAIERAFSFDISGLVLTGWGRDRADLLLHCAVSEGDLEHVLGIVSGRDVTSQPFRELSYGGDGTSSVDTEAADDWALAVCELAFGDLNVGWLFVARSDGERYAAQDNALLQGIAAHAGAAFGRAALFARIRDDYAKTIAALSATLDYGERAPAGHAGRVMEYAMAIGEEMGLSFDEIEQLRFAGLLHDIGKTGVPEEILLKPSALSPEEMATIRRHPEIGASIVEQIEFLKSLTPVILHHHEHWDGSGYPQGLSGKDIPVLSRILAVADAYDAMTSERSYRKRMTIAQARLELKSLAGGQFDPAVVGALDDVLDRMALAGGGGLLAGALSKGHAGLPA